MITYICDRPLLSHALLGAAYTAALAPLMTALGLPVYVGAVLVSVLFFGREAGPREHQLKRHMGPVKAWLGAETGWLWTNRNWMEWLTPTLAAAAVTILFALAK